MTIPPMVQPPAPSAPAMSEAQLGMRIPTGDPGYPRELWGKTIAEALRYYGIMREDFISRSNAARGQPPLVGQPGGPAAPAPAPAQPPAPRPAWQPPAPPAPPPAQPAFDMEALQGMIESAVSRAFGPVASVSAQSVYQQVRSEFPDWATYDAEIQESLVGADPGARLNPELWRSAYFHAKGRAMSTRSAAVPSAPPVPRDSRGAVVTPPPDFSGFTEAPTAPAPPGTGGFADPMDEVMAQRFGIPVEEYRLWKDGNVPPMRAPVPGGNNGR